MPARPYTPYLTSVMRTVSVRSEYELIIFNVRCPIETQLRRKFSPGTWCSTAFVLPVTHRLDISQPPATFRKSSHHFFVTDPPALASRRNHPNSCTTSSPLRCKLSALLPKPSKYSHVPRLFSHQAESKWEPHVRNVAVREYSPQLTFTQYVRSLPVTVRQ